MDWRELDNMLTQRGAYKPCPCCGYEGKPGWVKTDEQYMLVQLTHDKPPAPRFDEGIIVLPLMCVNCCYVRLHAPQFFGEPYRTGETTGDEVH
jgi:hypothetical protein